MFNTINLYKASNNKYKILNNISDGAYSRVYTCKDMSNNAINVVKIQPMCDKKYAINEINILNKIKKHTENYTRQYKSSNIIKKYNYYYDDEYFYIIFELCNTDLDGFIEAYYEEFNKSLPLCIIKKIIKSLFNGCNELHYNNIIHSDIKLNNILIKFNDVMLNNKNYTVGDMNQFINLCKKTKDKSIILNSFEIKLIDFNKSCFINQVCKSTNVQILNYQAPEIVVKNDKFNETIDLWSICCIIWELFTNEYFVDVYNEGKIHTFNVDNSDESDSDERDSDDTDDSNDSNSDDSNSDDGSSNGSDGSSNGSDSYSSAGSEYEVDVLDNYVYLLTLQSYLGVYNCNKNKDDDSEYYSNGLLMGNNVFSLTKKNILEELLKKSNNDNKEYITKLYNNVMKKIMIYNFTNRIKSKEIVEIINNM